LWHRSVMYRVNYDLFTPIHADAPLVKIKSVPETPTSTNISLSPLSSMSDTTERAEDLNTPILLETPILPDTPVLYAEQYPLPPSSVASGRSTRSSRSVRSNVPKVSGKTGGHKTLQWAASPKKRERFTELQMERASMSSVLDSASGLETGSVVSLSRAGTDPVLIALSSVSPVSQVTLKVRGREFPTPLQAYVFARGDDILTGEVPTLYDAVLKYSDERCVGAAMTEAQIYGKELSKVKILGNIEDSQQMLEVTMAVLMLDNTSSDMVIKGTRMRRIVYSCEDPVIGSGLDGKGQNLYGMWMSVAVELYSLLRCTL
jgi:hypothetical protein